jgi:hypothetical protein
MWMNMKSYAEEHNIWAFENEIYVITEGRATHYASKPRRMLNSSENGCSENYRALLKCNRKARFLYTVKISTKIKAEYRCF